ncbi:MAG TPA: hypothetical protein PLT38_07345 [Rubrivivax sp.]|nr:hypothetical protein [Rubrivivax sp.]
MWLLVLEALAALALLLFAVWWTMFSGRRRDAPADSDAQGSEGDEGGADAPRRP